MARTLTVIILAALVVIATGLPAGAQKGPIKIGVISPMTGGAAQAGKDMTNGMQMWLDENGNQMAGRKVEMIIEDSQGQPNIALTKLQKLVERDQVHVLVGELFAHIGYAMAPKVDEYRIPMLYPVIAADDLTQRKPAKWVVRTGWTSSQPSHPFGEYAAKTLGYKKIVTIGIDYAFGWEVIGGFQKTFEENGGQIVQKIWTPLNTTDFSPFIAQIKGDADAVFAVFFGRGSLQFVKQYADSGLKTKIPLLGNGTVTDESVLPQMGEEALGVYTALHYSAALDNPANKKYAKAFEAKAGKVPSYYAETCYTNMRWIVEAIKAINGKVEDREAFLAALKKVELKDFPRGPVVIDKWGNPIQNVYIRKVERVGGALQNSVIFTYPAVSQFWKYNPEEFLKMPLYTRDYPPCKYC